MNNYENAIEVIGQAIFDYFPDRDGEGIPLTKEEKEASEEINKFLSLVDESYVLVQWPESQEYMEKEWFDEEAILNIDMPSAYFIPLKYIME